MATARRKKSPPPKGRLKKTPPKKGAGVFEEKEGVYRLTDIDWDRQTCRVQKFKANGDGYQEEHGYLIDEGQCSCRGFHYNQDCRHFKMLTGRLDGKVLDLQAARGIAQEIIDSYVKDGLVKQARIIGDIRRFRPLVRIIHIVVVPTDPLVSEARQVGWIQGVPAFIDFRKSNPAQG